MAFYARRSTASRLSHHLSRRLHPSLPHLLSSHSHDDPPNPSPPTPPPPFHSQFPQPCSRAQSLNLLPFALHFAPHRSFSSSSPPSGEVDIATVLTDAVVPAASAAAPAPFPGEVAAAAAESCLPVAALQHLIDAVHSFTGLNWWLSIALSTVLIRYALYPQLIRDYNCLRKMSMMTLEQRALLNQLDNAKDLKSQEEAVQRAKVALQKLDISPPLSVLMIPATLTSFFLAVSNMVEKVPSLKGGGAFWFTDLTIPDALYISPVLISLSFMAVLEFSKPYKMARVIGMSTAMNLMRGVFLLVVPLTANLPQAICCCFITWNITSIIEFLAVRNSWMRKLLGIEPEPVRARKPTFSSYDGPKGTSAVDSPSPAKEHEQSGSSETRTSSVADLHRIRDASDQKPTTDKDSEM